MKTLIKNLFWLIGWILSPLFRLIGDSFGSLFGGVFGRLFQSNSELAQRRRLAKKQADRILSELKILKFTSRTKKGALRTIKYEYPLLMTHDELWLPIDLRNRPDGVSTNAFRDENVIRSLEDRCNSAIRVDNLANGKLCYVVRLGGTAFPEKFPFNSLQLAPDAPMLTIPLGIGAEGQAFVDLERLPHLLIAGETGRGKSTFLHTMLMTWISRNNANELELWLADHKGGAELGRYQALMGKKAAEQGIVRRFSSSPEETLEMLQAAMTELGRRTALLKQANASNAEDYSKVTGQYLRRIVLVIDEIVDLLLNKQRIDKYPIGKWGENLITRLASQGRAAGIYIVIATQIVESACITPLIKANFGSRVAFGVADRYRSQVVIDNGAADSLPVGRMIFRRDGELTEYQSCYISSQQTRLVLGRIAKYGPDGGLGKVDEANRFLADAKLLLITACERLDGDFARSKLLQQEGVRGVISQERYGEIAKRLEQDGIIEGGGPRKPRRVSRGYFGRVQLLDMVYGTQTDKPYAVNRMQTVSSDDANGLPVDDTGIGDDDAGKHNRDNHSNTVYGLQKTEPDPPLPPFLDSFLRQLDRPAGDDEEPADEDDNS